MRHHIRVIQEHIRIIQDHARMTTIMAKEPVRVYNDGIKLIE